MLSVEIENLEAIMWDNFEATVERLLGRLETSLGRLRSNIGPGLKVLWTELLDPSFGKIVLVGLWLMFLQHCYQGQ